MTEVVYSHAEGVVAEELPDGLLVARADGGQWLILRGTSVDLWHALVVPQTLGELVGHLGQVYIGAAEQILADVTVALTEFESAGVVRRDAPPKT
jgi:hypothetical protein